MQEDVGSTRKGSCDLAILGPSVVSFDEALDSLLYVMPPLPNPDRIRSERDEEALTPILDSREPPRLQSK